MKCLRIISIYTLIFTSIWGYSQEEVDEQKDHGFYQRMALSDAQMEESLRFASQEDEADYWKDQLNFEKRLKEKAYSSYKTYILFKSKAYLSHQAECDITANHGRGYNRQALFYNTQGFMAEEASGDISGDRKPLSLTVQRY